MSFLLVDKINELIPGKITRGAKTITGDEYYVRQDDAGLLYFIPSLIGEALGQLTAWNVMFSVNFAKRPVAGIVSSACMHHPVHVGDTLILESYIDELDADAVRYHGNVKVLDKEVFTLSSALGPLLPMTDFIDQELVESQFAQLLDKNSHMLSSIEFDLPQDRLNTLRDVRPDFTKSSASYMNFDNIIENIPGEKLIAIKRIEADAPFFNDHFPNKPVLPMTVLLECKRNLANIFLQEANFKNTFRLNELRKVKMNEFVHPNDEIICTLTLKNYTADKLILNYITEVNQKRVCVSEAHFIAREKT